MNAFLLIDKPAGISSFDVIRQLRKATGIRKIGHAGTLDPFATGLLICAMGQYTRLLKYAEAKDKTYEATLLLGKRSATGDPEGEIVEQRDVTLAELDSEHLKCRAIALQELQLPIYSAIKIDGKRAYQYAREGRELQMPMRDVQIYDFELLEQHPCELRYRVRVAKGTYIRSFSEWLAEQLGTIGMTSELRRTAIGKLKVDKACGIDSLESWTAYICDPRLILSGIAEYQASPDEANDLTNGRAIQLNQDIDIGEYAVYQDADLIAIAHCDGQQIKPQLVFNKDIEH